jgi:hypothetical protein
MILLQEHKLEIEFLQEPSLLKIRWVGQLQPLELKSLVFHLMEFAKVHAVKNILIDATYIIESPAMAEAWIKDFFSLELASTAIERMARVDSGNKEHDAHIKTIFGELERKKLLSYQFKQFQRYYEAMDWLVDGKGDFYQHSGSSHIDTRW